MLLTKLKNKLFSLIQKEKVTERLDYINPQKISYSQSGEDLIVDYIFKVRGLDNVSYLDIGANHPCYLNNTYIFYLKGSKGVNIEPNPKMIERFHNQRPNDVSIAAGAAPVKGELTYYELDSPELNTFSKEHALHMQEKGHTIHRETILPVITINYIIETYFNNISPNVLFIDTEGMDFDLVNSIDFTKYQPEVLCVESVSYELDGSGEKDTKLIDLILSKGYMLYADTNINSIFVRKDFWLI
jgi:FkbM family methyltransferase